MACETFLLDEYPNQFFSHIIFIEGYLMMVISKAFALKIGFTLKMMDYLLNINFIEHKFCSSNIALHLRSA